MKTVVNLIRWRIGREYSSKFALLDLQQFFSVLI